MFHWSLPYKLEALHHSAIITTDHYAHTAQQVSVLHFIQHTIRNLLTWPLNDMTIVIAVMHMGSLHVNLQQKNGDCQF